MAVALKKLNPLQIEWDYGFKYYIKNRIWNRRYKSWKKGIFKKYECTCAKCGATTDLVAGHIYDFKTYPHLRVHPDNGVCLCKTHEQEFHLLYGNGNNNVYQMKDYLFNDANKAEFLKSW